MICYMLIMNMPLWITVYLRNKWCLNLESWILKASSWLLKTHIIWTYQFIQEQLSLPLYITEPTDELEFDAYLHQINLLLFIA